MVMTLVEETKVGPRRFWFFPTSHFTVSQERSF